MRIPVVTALLAVAGCGVAGDDAAPRLVLGTTHTVEDSGLLVVIDSMFRQEHGARYRLSIVIAGSGEVLTLARSGDVDVVLSHSPADEIALVSDGAAASREPVMHNDFVLLGPDSDPAGVRTAASAGTALRRVEQSGAPFVSRGDGSGTHRRELALWAATGRAPAWPGYLEAGAGMADALRVASQRGAYVLSDRATFEMLRSELLLEVLFEDATSLLNQYSVLVASNARNRQGARVLAGWIRGPAMQRAIARYGTERAGRRLFHPGAPEQP